MLLISRKLVLTKLTDAFPDPDVAAQAIAALDRFEGPSRHAVQLAIVKLSEGQLWKLRELVREARKDFRNVLYPAQAPEQFRALNARRDPTRSGARLPAKRSEAQKEAAARKDAAMQERDQRQWLEWLSFRP